MYDVRILFFFYYFQKTKTIIKKKNEKCHITLPLRLEIEHRLYIFYVSRDFRENNYKKNLNDEEMQVSAYFLIKKNII